jgi:hypothetical protein
MNLFQALEQMLVILKDFALAVAFQNTCFRGAKKPD